jgi:hypothetical protein
MTSQINNFNTQIHKFTAPVIARNVHNIKSPKSAKFVMTNVHNDKNLELWHKMVITSKFHTNKLNKSAVGCVRPLLLMPRLWHDVTTLDARVPLLALAWRSCGLGQRQSIM